MAAGLIAVLVNVGCWCFLLSVQNLECRLGRIPKRRGWKDDPDTGVPHLQDWYTNGPFGDVIALSLVDAAVAMTAYHQGLKFWMVPCVFAGIIIAYLFYKVATREERVRMNMDWWFQPKMADGRSIGIDVSWAGRVHLVYFAAQVTVALIGTAFLVFGEMTGMEIALGLSGAGLYSLAFLADARAGHFKGPFR